jgi:hypothetical protein
MLEVFEKHLDEALKERSFQKSFEAAKTKEEQIAFCKKFIADNEKIPIRSITEVPENDNLSLDISESFRSYNTPLQIKWLTCSQIIDTYEFDKAPWHEGVKEQVKINMLHRLMQDMLKHGLISWYEEKDFASLNVKVVARLGVVK